MLVLGIESSGLAASVALVEDDLLKAEFTVNNRLTHSETLLPMLEQMTRISGIGPADADAIAVSAGPGSFTGLRIGAATAKGLALALDRPLVRVSSLAALAYNAGTAPGRIVCPLMDARRGQVYCGAYLEGISLIPESAMDIHEFIGKLNILCEERAKSIKECLFLGDGVPVSQETIASSFKGDYSFEGACGSRQRAASVAALGERIYRDWLRRNRLTSEEIKTAGADAVSCFDDMVMNSDDFAPDYLRRPQAEREMAAGLLEDPGLHSLRKIARGEK